MRRWDVEIPIIRRERPDLQVLTCHDEYLTRLAVQKYRVESLGRKWPSLHLDIGIK
jgi:hypothetical protein